MKDLTGMKFGRITVVEFSHYYKCKNSGKRAMWKCICDCGNERVIRGDVLTSGKSRSCGCLQKELASERMIKHSGYGTRLYAVWDSVRQRCNNPNNKAYHNYGGRGIKMCEKWNDFNKFREWAFNNGYDENAKHGECTLDRIDTNGMYAPDNCRWCTIKQQSNNKRDTIYLEWNGEIKTLSEWSEKTGIKYCTLWKRYSKGLSLNEILKEVI